MYKRSSKNYLSKKEEYYYEKEYKQEKIKKIIDSIRANGCETPGCSLLDSSLISATNLKKCTHKIVQFGDYIQIYEFNEIKRKNDNNLIKMKDKNYNIEQISLSYINDNIEYNRNTYVGSTIDYINKTKKEKISENIKKDVEYKKIELKNINRSKFELQRLVKANEDIFKTFITLTFKDNVMDITLANKKFAHWRTQIRKMFSEFSYVCVPEFQKRGAIHYHILTNLDINENSNIIIPQKEFSEKQLKKMTLEQRKKCYDVKYWNCGFSSVFSVKDINVVGYMSKYMTKDIDNRLWGKRRYLYSQNLKTPTTLYLDLETADINDFFTYYNTIDKYELMHDSVYADKFGQAILFKEFKLKKE